MKVGIPSEIKAQESRVGLTPQSVQQLTNHGHEVLVENNAGFGAGFENADYEKAGAKMYVHQHHRYCTGQNGHHRN